MDAREKPLRPGCPKLSPHARIRAQARGIPRHIIDAILAHADRRYFVGQGRRALMVSRRRLDGLASVIPAADRERMAGVVLITNRFGNAIVTVLHVYGPRGRRYRRR
jgi:hypothetical protein